jgi:hypothetical protein
LQRLVCNRQWGAAAHNEALSRNEARRTLLEGPPGNNAKAAATRGGPTAAWKHRRTGGSRVDFRALIAHMHRSRPRVRPNSWNIHRTSPAGEIAMTTFDEREKSFEKRFALDEELKFKAEQRRNRLLGEWAAAKLGIAGGAVDDYVKALRKADLASKGDEDVFQKLRKDFDDKGVSVSDAELRKAMVDCLAQGVSQIEGERKG